MKAIKVEVLDLRVSPSPRESLTSFFCLAVFGNSYEIDLALSRVNLTI